jgi:RNA 2',3'-cyclic 3'-phosphodiesterase
MPSARSPAGTAKARLFVALDLPQEVVVALTAWREPLLRDERSTTWLRPVRRDSLHVTLCFLGWLDEAAVAPLSEVVATAGRQAGAVQGLAFAAPLWLPRRRPRALALGLSDRDGALGRLQRALAERLAAGSWYEPEARPYLPHVTVARVRGDGAALGRTVLPIAPELSFAGAAVTLYRSLLHPTRPPARYEPLFRHALV